MALRIFLTSDLHLGMKFAGFPGGVQEALVEARFQCLDRIAAAAQDSRCDLLVIAGDLFQSVGAARRDVERAARALEAFQGRLTVVLPGNHDFVAPEDSLWRRFRDAAGDRVLVLDEQRPYPLSTFDLDACLYPGPCTAKHSEQNAIEWVATAAKERGVRHHLGIAHGSLEGFSPDWDGLYYPMRIADLDGTGVPLWLLGHTHVPFASQEGAAPRFYCAGTPEPDGWDCAHDGAAVLLSVEDDGTARRESVRTGSLRFVQKAADVRTQRDVEQLVRQLATRQAPQTLLRLRLRGRADEDAMAAVAGLRESLGMLRHLDLRLDELAEEITPQAIERHYPAGSFPHALLTRLSREGDAEALTVAHDLLEELRT